MPIFEYECETCHQNFERLVFNDKEKKISCPCCGSIETRKLISCAGFLGRTSSGACASPAPSRGFS